jgi:hypothetical protein
LSGSSTLRFHRQVHKFPKHFSFPHF